MRYRSKYLAQLRAKATFDPSVRLFLVGHQDRSYQDSYDAKVVKVPISADVDFFLQSLPNFSYYNVVKEVTYSLVKCEYTDTYFAPHDLIDIGAYGVLMAHSTTHIMLNNKLYKLHNKYWILLLNIFTRFRYHNHWYRDNMTYYIYTSKDSERAEDEVRVAQYLNNPNMIIPIEKFTMGFIFKHTDFVRGSSKRDKYLFIDSVDQLEVINIAYDSNNCKYLEAGLQHYEIGMLFRGMIATAIVWLILILVTTAFTLNVIKT